MKRFLAGLFATILLISTVAVDLTSLSSVTAYADEIFSENENEETVIEEKSIEGISEDSIEDGSIETDSTQEDGIQEDSIQEDNIQEDSIEEDNIEGNESEENLTNETVEDISEEVIAKNLKNKITSSGNYHMSVSYGSETNEFASYSDTANQGALEYMKEIIESDDAANFTLTAYSGADIDISELPEGAAGILLKAPNTDDGYFFLNNVESQIPVEVEANVHMTGCDLSYVKSYGNPSAYWSLTLKNCTIGVLETDGYSYTYGYGDEQIGTYKGSGTLYAGYQENPATKGVFHIETLEAEDGKLTMDYGRDGGGTDGEVVATVNSGLSGVFFDGYTSASKPFALSVETNDDGSKSVVLTEYTAGLYKLIVKDGATVKAEKNFSNGDALLSYANEIENAKNYDLYIKPGDDYSEGTSISLHFDSLPDKAKSVHFTRNTKYDRSISQYVSVYALSCDYDLYFDDIRSALLPHYEANLSDIGSFKNVYVTGAEGTNDSTLDIYLPKAHFDTLEFANTEVIVQSEILVAELYEGGNAVLTSGLYAINPGESEYSHGIIKAASAKSRVGHKIIVRWQPSLYGNGSTSIMKEGDELFVFSQASDSVEADTGYVYDGMDAFELYSEFDFLDATDHYKLRGKKPYEWKLAYSNKTEKLYSWGDVANRINEIDNEENDYVITMKPLTDKNEPQSVTYADVAANSLTFTVENGGEIDLREISGEDIPAITMRDMDRTYIDECEFDSLTLNNVQAHFIGMGEYDTNRFDKLTLEHESTVRISLPFECNTLKTDINSSFIFDKLTTVDRTFKGRINANSLAAGSHLVFSFYDIEGYEKGDILADIKSGCFSTSFECTNAYWLEANKNLSVVGKNPNNTNEMTIVIDDYQKNTDDDIEEEANTYYVRIGKTGTPSGFKSWSKAVEYMQNHSKASSNDYYVYHTKSEYGAVEIHSMPSKAKSVTFDTDESMSSFFLKNISARIIYPVNVPYYLSIYNCNLSSLNLLSNDLPNTHVTLHRTNVTNVTMDNRNFGDTSLDIQGEVNVSKLVILEKDNINDLYSGARARVHVSGDNYTPKGYLNVNELVTPDGIINFDWYYSDSVAKLGDKPLIVKKGLKDVAEKRFSNDIATKVVLTDEELGEGYVVLATDTTERIKLSYDGKTETFTNYDHLLERMNELDSDEYDYVIERLPGYYERQVSAYLPEKAHSIRFVRTGNEPSAAYEILSSASYPLYVDGDHICPGLNYRDYHQLSFSEIHLLNGGGLIAENTEKIEKFYFDGFSNGDTDGSTWFGVGGRELIIDDLYYSDETCIERCFLNVNSGRYNYYDENDDYDHYSTKEGMGSFVINNIHMPENAKLSISWANLVAAEGDVLCTIKNGFSSGEVLYDNYTALDLRPTVTEENGAKVISLVDYSPITFNLTYKNEDNEEVSEKYHTYPKTIERIDAIEEENGNPGYEYTITYASDTREGYNSVQMDTFPQNVGKLTINGVAGDIAIGTDNMSPVSYPIVFDDCKFVRFFHCGNTDPILKDVTLTEKVQYVQFGQFMYFDLLNIKCSYVDLYGDLQVNKLIAADDTVFSLCSSEWNNLKVNGCIIANQYSATEGNLQLALDRYADPQPDQIAAKIKTGLSSVANKSKYHTEYEFDKKVVSNVTQVFLKIKETDKKNITLFVNGIEEGQYTYYASALKRMNELNNAKNEYTIFANSKENFITEITVTAFPAKAKSIKFNANPTENRGAMGGRFIVSNATADYPVYVCADFQLRSSTINSTLTIIPMDEYVYKSVYIENSVIDTLDLQDGNVVVYATEGWNYIDTLKGKGYLRSTINYDEDDFGKFSIGELATDDGVLNLYIDHNGKAVEGSLIAYVGEGLKSHKYADWMLEEEELIPTIEDDEDGGKVIVLRPDTNYRMYVSYVNDRDVKITEGFFTYEKAREYMEELTEANPGDIEFTIWRGFDDGLSALIMDGALPKDAKSIRFVANPEATEGCAQAVDLDAYNVTYPLYSYGVELSINTSQTESAEDETREHHFEKIVVRDAWCFLCGRNIFIDDLDVNSVLYIQGTPYIGDLTLSASSRLDITSYEHYDRSLREFVLIKSFLTAGKIEFDDADECTIKVCLNYQHPRDVRELGDVIIKSYQTEYNMKFVLDPSSDNSEYALKEVGPFLDEPVGSYYTFVLDESDNYEWKLDFENEYNADKHKFKSIKSLVKFIEDDYRENGVKRDYTIVFSDHKDTVSDYYQIGDRDLSNIYDKVNSITFATQNGCRLMLRDADFSVPVTIGTDQVGQEDVTASDIKIQVMSNVKFDELTIYKDCIGDFYYETSINKLTMAQGSQAKVNVLYRNESVSEGVNVNKKYYGYLKVGELSAKDGIFRFTANMSFEDAPGIIFASFESGYKGYEEISGPGIGINSFVSGGITYLGYENPVAYKIEFKGNNPTGTKVSGKMTNESFKAGEEKALSLNKFTISGYEFLGWSLWPDATTPTYGDGEVVKNLAHSENETITLFAVWKEISYSISYNPMGGVMPDNIITEYLSSVGLEELPIPTAPEGMVGYLFAGWYKSSAFNANELVKTIPINAKGNYELYAKWVPNTYNIVFDKNSEFATGTMNSLNVSFQDRVVLTANKFKNAKAFFLGWSDSSNYPESGEFYCDKAVVSNLINPSSEGNLSITLYAVWEDINTVNFDADGGTLTKNSLLELNYQLGESASEEAGSYSAIAEYGTVYKLPTPIRRGYKFNGWNNTATNKKITSVPKNQNGDINLTAMWTPYAFTVAFDGNGKNGGSMAAKKMTTDVEGVLTANNFVKKGYKFAGWSLIKNGEKVYDDGALVGFFSESADNKIDVPKSGAKITLYALWEETDYSIDYELNGGEFTEGTQIPENYEFGEAKVLPTPVRDNYKFVGWFLDSQLKKKASITKSTFGDQTLYAKWDAEYYVVFHGNGETSKTMKDQKMTAATEKALTANSFIKTGYAFMGWSTSEEKANSKEVVYINKQKLLNPSGIVFGEDRATIDLYAVWQDTFTVSFESNGGSVIEDINYSYGSAYTLPTPVREGYKFGGWYSDSTFKTKASITKTTSGDKTFYAKWTGLSYKVVFHNNLPIAGKVAFKNQSLTFGTPKALTKNAFKVKGYTFLGWSKEPSEYVPDYADAVSYSGTDAVFNSSTGKLGNVDLYAVWSKDVYEINYHNIEGINEDSDTWIRAYDVDSELIVLPTPSKFGFTFVGWYSDEKTSKKAANIKKGSVGNVDLYAKWKVNK